MTKEMSAKTKQILATKATTRERRKSLVCRTYDLKIDSSHFNATTKAWFSRVFLEAKWLYNYILATGVVGFDTKIKIVTILNKERQPEQRELASLGSQAKQGILERAIDNCVGLKESKKRGRHIGALKFKSVVNSVPFKQFGSDFRIVSDNHIELQKLKQRLRVKGLKQLKGFVEMSNATLVRRPDGFHLMVTGYEKPKEHSFLGDLGIDMGVATNLTFSNGIKINIKIPIDKRVKKAGRKVNKTVKGSKNRWRARERFQRAHQHRNNQKSDAVNKIISYLNNFHVAIQNEMIAQWQKGLFGKAVSISAMGEIKRELKLSPHTLVVPRSFPSTQLCPNCGSLNKRDLSERTYSCACGYSADRDIHSARNILAERKNYKPVENETTAAMLEYLKTIPHIVVSFAQ